MSTGPEGQAAAHLCTVAALCVVVLAGQFAVCVFVRGHAVVVMLVIIVKVQI